MKYRPPTLERQFKAFQDGQLEQLEELMASEKGRLFDYLMRMTGQLSKSAETTEEAINAVSAVADQADSLQDLLITLYKTARNFAIDAWNADTSRLENSSYAEQKSSESKLNDRLLASMVSAEQVIRSLAPHQREVLLLHERYGFASDEVCLVTGYPLSDVEETFPIALAIVESAMTDHAISVPDLITKLHAFTIPDDGDETTQNLSLVFKNLKKSSSGLPTSWSRVFFLILGIILVVFMVWQRDLTRDYLLELWNKFQSLN
jgi:DNA-directed RNA polymerase specialized sigma24 family protein